MPALNLRSDPGVRSPANPRTASHPNSLSRGWVRQLSQVSGSHPTPDIPGPLHPGLLAADIYAPSSLRRPDIENLNVDRACSLPLSLLEDWRIPIRNASPVLWVPIFLFARYSGVSRALVRPWQMSRNQGAHGPRLLGCRGWVETDRTYSPDGRTWFFSLRPLPRYVGRGRDRRLNPSSRRCNRQICQR